LGPAEAPGAVLGVPCAVVAPPHERIGGDACRGLAVEVRRGAATPAAAAAAAAAEDDDDDDDDDDDAAACAGGGTSRSTSLSRWA
jgi:hypothetical protein